MFNAFPKSPGRFRLPALASAAHAYGDVLENRHIRQIADLIRSMPKRTWLAAGSIAFMAAMLLQVGTQQAPISGIDHARPAVGRRVAQRIGILPNTMVGSLTVADTPTISDFAAAEARANNAAVPFTAAHFKAAPPYHYTGDAANRSGAMTCLAAAVLYEAGDDKLGEEAVAQVVLNRLRHPAFPKSVCGVIFQGSDRSSGCQFTFTCDGSLSRTPNPGALARARIIADAALSGAVLKEVGSATHYHTDWVVPYWRSSLEKLAQVHTQIFYRWPDWQAKRQDKGDHANVPEIVDPRLEEPSQAGAPVAMTTPAGVLTTPVSTDISLPRSSAEVPGVAVSTLKGNDVLLADTVAGRFFLHLNSSAYPGSWAVVAYSICNGRPDCSVIGWTNVEQVPETSYVSPTAHNLVAFDYEKHDEQTSIRWDCQRYARHDSAQCMGGTTRETATPIAHAPANAAGLGNPGDEAAKN